MMPIEGVRLGRWVDLKVGRKQEDNWGKALQRVGVRARKRKISAKVHINSLNGLCMPLVMELHSVWQLHLMLIHEQCMTFWEETLSVSRRLTPDLVSQQR